MRKFLVSLIAIFCALVSVWADGKAESYVACLGRVVPNARISKLSAAAPNGAQSVVANLLVARGDMVKLGQPIADLCGYARAKADLSRAEAALASVKAAAAVQILKQKNLLADLQGTFKQNDDVIKQKSPPRRELEQLEYEQDTLSRHIAQASVMLPLVEASQKAIVAEAEAALAVSRAYLDEFIVRSPISGRVVELNIRQGEAVGMDGICEIADTSKMFVEAEVYVSDISKIKIGSKVEIFGDALGKDVFSGKVVEVMSYVKGNRIFSSDPTDFSNLRVVPVKIALDNSSAFSRFIGSHVNVRIFANGK